jgi:hypothetical protein
VRLILRVSSALTAFGGGVLLHIGHTTRLPQSKGDSILRFRPVYSCTAAISTRSRQLCVPTAGRVPGKLVVMRSLALHRLSRGQYYVAEEPMREASRPTVYLDTTIPSYLAARSRRNLLSVRRQRITRIWWERHRRRYELRVSYRVISEAFAGDPLYANQRARILDGIEFFDSDPQSEELANVRANGFSLS